MLHLTVLCSEVQAGRKGLVCTCSLSKAMQLKAAKLHAYNDTFQRTQSRPEAAVVIKTHSDPSLTT